MTDHQIDRITSIMCNIAGSALLWWAFDWRVAVGVTLIGMWIRGPAVNASIMLRKGQ